VLVCGGETSLFPPLLVLFLPGIDSLTNLARRIDKGPSELARQGERKVRASRRDRRRQSEAPHEHSGNHSQGVAKRGLNESATT